MMYEILNKYQRFSDSLIYELSYKPSFNSPYSKGDLEIIIKCMNAQNDYEWEVIKLMFGNVLSFRYIESERTSSSVINSALLKKENDLIVIDFFPLIFDNAVLKENNNSDFIVKSKELKYLIIENYSPS